MKTLTEMFCKILVSHFFYWWEWHSSFEKFSLKRIHRKGQKDTQEIKKIHSKGQRSKGKVIKGHHCFSLFAWIAGLWSFVILCLIFDFIFWFYFFDLCLYCLNHDYCHNSLNSWLFWKNINEYVILFSMLRIHGKK